MHIIGTVIGAGAVTTAYARELYFKWHPAEMHKRGSLPVITWLLNIGFALIIISGMGLFGRDPNMLTNNPGFILKLVLVGLLLANHILINTWLRSKKETFTTLSTISDYFSLLGWYAIIIISVYI